MQGIVKRKVPKPIPPPTTAYWVGEVLHLTTRIPAMCLRPNGREHYHPKAAETKAMRDGVAFAVAQWEHRPLWKAATYTATFYWPTKGRRDKDNAAASLKAVQDGMADAGVVANDDAFTPEPPRMAYDKARPRVELVIREVK